MRAGHVATPDNSRAWDRCATFRGMRGRHVLVLALAVAPAAVSQARAQAIDEDPDPSLGQDNDLGPQITIEAITIRGNTTTQEELIRRALPIAPGDTLKQSDSRLRDARFKLLALGFFREVELAMHKGSARGQVVIEITVLERGTFVLNRLWFGRSDFSHYWAGADVGDRNVLGLGISVGGGLIYAAPGDDSPESSQWAGELRLGAGGIAGSRLGLDASLTLVHGSDIAAQPFTYRRFGGRAGASYDVLPLLRVSAGARLEQVTHDAVDVPWLDSGESRILTGSVGLDLDTRNDPILPHAGTRVTTVLEAGATDYEYAALYVHGEQWFPLLGRRQAIGVRVDGVFTWGDTPRFDRVYLVDVDRMLTPRAMGLLLSRAEPFHILNDDDAPAIGTSGVLAALEYTRELWRGSGRRRVYGGDLFLSAGAWTIRNDGLSTADLYFDAGLRIDTEVGIFELAVANALGRVR